ncbi:MAG: DNA topoisomerase IB [Burkholderiales bacterium]
MSDDGHGIRRLASKTGFRYLDSDGRRIRDAGKLARIKSLVVPPAWREVWISPFAESHLQATGRDARGRKQYRYHHRWHEWRDDAKYARVIAFAKALPRIRARVSRDLRKPVLSRDRVLATVVRLLESCLFRIGNKKYARDNNSFGLTTLRDKHTKIRGTKLQFEFQGKSGKPHRIEIQDPRLAVEVKSCRDLPGRDLFQYVDEGGECHSISSSDVNAYLRKASGGNFTAKDFRTWAGTVAAARALSSLPSFDSRANAKKNIAHVIESVAKRLGNTPAVCRKSYIHPAVLEAYVNGETIRHSAMRSRKSIEAAIVALLRKRLAAQKPDLRRRLAASLRAGW